MAVDQVLLEQLNWWSSFFTSTSILLQKPRSTFSIAVLSIKFNSSISELLCSVRNVRLLLTLMPNLGFYQNFSSEKTFVIKTRRSMSFVVIMIRCIVGR